ncbi:MAG: phosphoglycolate phosphatase [Candidatus Hodarchaeota archaeon]
MFRAVATDIDGTITYANKHLSFEAINEIRQLEEKGIPVILVTGHMFCVAGTLSEYIGTSGPLVCENGSVIASERWKTPIVLGSRRKTDKALAVLRRELGELVKVKPHIDYRLVDISLQRTFDVAKGNMVLEKYKLGVYLMDSNYAIHIADDNVNKAKGLRKAAEMINTELNEIVGIGDGRNDISMLEETGYGIALNNAPEELKRVADYVTRDSYGKGFVEAIDHLKQNSFI